MTEQKPARVRFAPSPTGYLHIGGARTALYNYLVAKQTGGQFLLRIEDTDRARFVADAEKDLKDSLRWLGLQWDEGPEVGGPAGPYIQSERAELHSEHAKKLVELGKAYPCFCSRERLDEVRREQRVLKKPPRYDGHCRNIAAADAQSRIDAGESYVIRFKVPTEGDIVVEDKVRGAIRVAYSQLDDFVLQKSDGYAVYHLAAMVDDHFMGITHVMRGEEWIPSLPKHAMIIRAFGWDEPEWVHLTVFNKPSGKGKLSKRDIDQFKEGGHSIFVKDLKAIGYMPEAVNNWMSLMGWGYDDKTEFFSPADLIEKFSLERLTASPAAVNFAKLDFFQGNYVRALSEEELAAKTKPFYEAAGYTVDDALLLEIMPLIQERIVTFDDAPDISGFLFNDTVSPDPALLIAKKHTVADAIKVLAHAIPLLRDLPDFTAAATHPALRDLSETVGFKVGPTLQPIRIAITGQKVHTPLFETMEIIGRETVLERLENAKLALESYNPETD